MIDLVEVTCPLNWLFHVCATFTLDVNIHATFTSVQWLSGKLNNTIFTQPPWKRRTCQKVSCLKGALDCRASRFAIILYGLCGVVLSDTVDYPYHKWDAVVVASPPLPNPLSPTPLARTIENIIFNSTYRYVRNKTTKKFFPITL